MYPLPPSPNPKWKVKNSYTRVLTRVQLTFGCEPSSNPLTIMDVVIESIHAGYNLGLGSFTLEANPG